MTAVLTRSERGERAGTDPTGGPGSPRDGERRPRHPRRWPSGRSALGAVLIVMAGAGVLAAHRAASTPPGHRWIVAARDVPAGAVLSADDLGTVAAELPDGLPAVPANDARTLLGSVALVPLERMTMLRPADLGDPDTTAADGTVEVPIQIDRSRDLGDSIHVGSRVDVLSTDADLDGTTALARNVPVLDVTDAEDLGIGGGDAVRYRLALPDADTAAAVVDASVRSQLTLVAPRGGANGG